MRKSLVLAAILAMTSMPPTVLMPEPRKPKPKQPESAKRHALEKAEAKRKRKAEKLMRDAERRGQ